MGVMHIRIGMFKNLLTITSSLLLFSGCAMIKDYVPPKGGETSKVVVTRDIEAPFLGSSTYIYKVANFRECRGGLEGKEDTRLMTLDTGNPLVSEFNADGVEVSSNEILRIKLFTVAGQYNQCSVFVGFTPDKEKDYHVKLLGRVNISPHQCRAELWSTKKGTNIVNKENFDNYDGCAPK
jgi:hypothetical protein